MRPRDIPAPSGLLICEILFPLPGMRILACPTLPRSGNVYFLLRISSGLPSSVKFPTEPFRPSSPTLPRLCYAILALSVPPLGSDPVRLEIVPPFLAPAAAPTFSLLTLLLGVRLQS